MKVNRKHFFLLAGLVVLAGGLWTWLRPKEPAVPRGVITVQAAADTAGFARADGPRTLVFPADFGPHLEFQTEWWYYTGNLDAPDGRHFGFQLTFFRRALVPPVKAPKRSSDWAADQVYMAHFALTDVGGQRYAAFERLERGAAGLAGVQAQPFAAWLKDWKVTEVGPGSYRLDAAAIADEYPFISPLRLSLELKDTHGPVLQGNQGYSQKGPLPGQASYYYSLPRLAASGEVLLGSQHWQVTGLAWMDHEFSTSALGAGQVGWDWFAMQFQDGSELMVFQIRRADGTKDAFSSGTWITPDGESHPIRPEDFHIQASGKWKSPHSGATYPAGWQISLPSLKLELVVQPFLPDQELNVSYAYWEGAVSIQGQLDGHPVKGSGYVELTGYSGSMGGQF